MSIKFILGSVMQLPDYVNKAAHITIGAISGISWFVASPFLSAFIFLLFMLYEVVETMKIEDELYHEIKEFCIGFTAAVSYFLILTAVSL